MESRHLSIVVYRSEGFPHTGYLVPGRIGWGPGTPWTVIVVMIPCRENTTLPLKQLNIPSTWFKIDCNGLDLIMPSIFALLCWLFFLRMCRKNACIMLPVFCRNYVGFLDVIFIKLHFCHRNGTKLCQSRFLGSDSAEKMHPGTPKLYQKWVIRISDQNFDPSSGFCGLLYVYNTPS